MRKSRKPWTLRTRLVVSAVSLIAVVAAVIGSVTAIAFHSYMYGKLDDQLHSIAVRAERPPGPSPLVAGLRAAGPLGFIGGGGQPFGTLGAVVVDGTVTESKVVEDSGQRAQESAEPLTGAQRAALENALADGLMDGLRDGPDASDPDASGPDASGSSTGGEARGIDLPGLGGYRVEAVATSDGDTVLVGIPSDEVSSALTALILVEVCVTAAGLTAAGIAGAAMVGVALRPLRRVAAAATRVSELPLHSGEVALFERVPDAEADPRTEVGQVGAALNRMLGHVGSALAARQDSEMRVRQFVADASHELRTPLASIRGYAELTRRGREDTGPDTRHALGRIESEAQRMTGMVEDLLLLARLDAGRPLSYESTDLLPLVVDAVSDARVAGEAGGGPGAGPDGGPGGGPGGGPSGGPGAVQHHWRLELPDAPTTVRADPPRIQQVLVNLLANARTHTPPGTTVTVRVRAASAGLPRVTLEVEDDGPGIPAGLLPHVFERFARGDASRSRGAGSTGLGLAIVEAVVAAHGGRVEVRSEPGRTVFAVRLPADPAATGSGTGFATRSGTGSATRSVTDPCAGPGTGLGAGDSQGGHRLSTPV
ncbi:MULTISPECIES: cell wall metabolism sensor histidine kinase WalK [unclassified Streptomyces]|uniref:sensor histidine kinase n=1 Tax=Streptomyces sp. NPDC060054 TaxID=3347048 RepID=UPI00093EE41D|nr:HAMP domain-containing sensor histidine kinase [Streptomyces sp. TSRI0281]OKI32987.1 two-component sensor histidine kinase [Streptomyces sp. TSRI0281]